METVVTDTSVLTTTLTSQGTAKEGLHCSLVLCLVAPQILAVAQQIALEKKAEKVVEHPPALMAGLTYFIKEKNYG